MVNVCRVWQLKPPCMCAPRCTATGDARTRRARQKSTIVKCQLINFDKQKATTAPFPFQRSCAPPALFVVSPQTAGEQRPICPRNAATSLH